MKVVREGHECRIEYVIAARGTIIECEECGKQWKRVEGSYGYNTWRPVIFRRRA